MPLNAYRWRPARGRSIAIALSTLAAASAGAANFRIEPRIEVGGLYNDNYRLHPVDENEVSGGLADATVSFRSVTPTSDFSITPRLRSTYFPDDRDDDANSQYLMSDYGYRGQRNRFGFEALYSREDLLTSEQPGADFIDPDLGGGTGVETGTLRVRNRRDLIRFSPSASFDLTQTRALEVGLAYVNADYERNVLDSITDFDSLSGNVGLSFGLSPTQRLSIAAVGTTFDPDTPVAGESTSYGLRGELWTTRSEVFESYLRLGAERTEEDDPEIGVAADASTNYILGAGITARYQVTTIFADYSRGVRPNASGELATRDDVRIRVRRNFTPTTTGFIGVLGANDTSAQDDDDFRDRRYITGSAGIEWRFTREFALVASYDYRRQKRDLEGTGTSNQVVLSVVYQPPRREGSLSAP